MAKVKVKPDSQTRLMDRYRKSRPEMEWDNEETEVDVDEMAADELERYDSERAKDKEANDRLSKMLATDNAAAAIFVDWSKGKDPIESFIEQLGDDLIESIQSEGGKEKFKEALNKWRKGKNAEIEHKKVYDSNIQQTAQNLIAFADSKGISDEEVTSLVDKVWQFGSNVADGLFTPEMLEMVYKANNYEDDMKNARREGFVDGKNENIAWNLRKSKPATGLPPTAGGQNAVTVESKPERPREGNISMFGGIPIRRK